MSGQRNLWRESYDKIRKQRAIISVFKNKEGERRKRIKNMFTYRVNRMKFTGLEEECLFTNKYCLPSKIIPIYRDFTVRIINRITELFSRFQLGYPLSLALANMVGNYFISILRFKSINMVYMDDFLERNRNRNICQSKGWLEYLYEKQASLDWLSGDSKESDRKCIIHKDKLKKEEYRSTENYIFEHQPDSWKDDGWLDKISKTYNVPSQKISLDRAQDLLFTYLTKLRNDFAEEIINQIINKTSGKYDKLLLDQYYTMVNIIGKKSEYLPATLESEYDLESIDIFNWAKILSYLDIDLIGKILVKVIDKSKQEYYESGWGMFSLFGLSFIKDAREKIIITDQLPCNCSCNSLLFLSIMESTGYPPSLLYSNVQDSHWATCCIDMVSQLESSFYYLESRKRQVDTKIGMYKNNLFYSYLVDTISQEWKMANGKGKNLNNSGQANTNIIKLLSTVRELCEPEKYWISTQTQVPINFRNIIL